MTPKQVPEEVSKTVLPAGVRVLTERMPHVRSVALGVWVDRGSRHESEAEHGLTHFAEHMVFKGTETRSAEDIACAVDAMGGHLDAFTSKENVAFTAKVLDEHLPRVLDIVADMVLNPVFKEDDIEKEKGVVLEELKMDEDNPDYLVHELFTKRFWPNHPLGRTIIGTKPSIEGFSRPALDTFFRKTLQPRNVLITAAGRLQHDETVRLIEERFGGLSGDERTQPVTPPEPEAAIVLRDKPALEQTNLCLGLPAYRIADERRFAGYVLSTLLGGGVSSRLFLKIREQAGLVYSVYSDLTLYSDVGSLCVCAGTSIETAKEVIDMVLAEFRDLKANRIADDELRRAKDHLKGSLMLSLESTSSRMTNLARQEKYFGRTFTLDEVTERIEKVTADDVRDVATDWFRCDRLAAAVLGDLQGFKLEPSDLVC